MNKKGSAIFAALGVTAVLGFTAIGLRQYTSKALTQNLRFMDEEGRYYLGEMAALYIHDCIKKGMNAGNCARLPYPSVIPTNFEANLSWLAGNLGSSAHLGFRGDNASYSRNANQYCGTMIFGDFVPERSICVVEPPIASPTPSPSPSPPLPSPTPVGGGNLAVASGMDKIGSAAIKVFDVFTGILKFTITPNRTYGVNYGLGIDMAMGDFNGDGIADIVTVPGRQMAPTVHIFDGSNGAKITSFLIPNAYFNLYLGQHLGYHVAVGDLNGDGLLDIAVTEALAPPKVVVYTNNGNGTFSMTCNFAPFSAFSTYQRGALISIADVLGDGRAELVIAGGGDLAGLGMDARVKVYRPSGPTAATLLLEFLDPLKHSFNSLVTTDIEGTSKAEILIGASGNLTVAANQVSIFNGTSGALIRRFAVFPAVADPPTASILLAVRNKQIYAAQEEEGTTTGQIRKFDANGVRDNTFSLLTAFIYDTDPYFRRAQGIHLGN